MWHLLAYLTERIMQVRLDVSNLQKNRGMIEYKSRLKGYFDRSEKEMKKEQLKEYVANGREIEFEYKGKEYSITYGVIDGQEVISFCEFYKETTEVQTYEELLKVSRDGVTVAEMWESLKENDIWLY